MFFACTFNLTSVTSSSEISRGKTSKMMSSISTILPKLSEQELNKRDVFGRTLSHILVLCNRYDLLKYLLKNPNWNVLTVDLENGWNCLHYAIYNRNFVMSNMLLSRSNERDALVRAKDKEGYTPLDLLGSEMYKPKRVPDFIGEAQDVKNSIARIVLKSNQKSSDVSEFAKAPKTNLLQLSQDQLQNFDLGKSIGSLSIDQIECSKSVLLILAEGKVFTNKLGTPQYHQVKGLLEQEIAAVALGDQHSLALTTSGDVFSWGDNSHGQLGYQESVKSAEKVYGGDLKKREHTLKGVSCSSVHSVAYSADEIFFWGLNNGQMGFTGEVEHLPKKLEFRFGKIKLVAVSNQISFVVTSEDELHIYLNGYHCRSAPPLTNKIEEFHAFKPKEYSRKKKVVKVVTRDSFPGAALLLDNGSILQITLDLRAKDKMECVSRIKYSALWQPTKPHLKCVDVDMAQDGTIVLCTEDGAVHLRVRRPERAQGWKFLVISKVNKIVQVATNPSFTRFQMVRSEVEMIPHKVCKSSFLRDIAKLSPLEGDCVNSDDRITSDGKDFEKSYLDTSFSFSKRCIKRLQDAKYSIRASETADTQLVMPDLKKSIPVHFGIISARCPFFLKLPQTSGKFHFAMSGNQLSVSGPVDFQAMLFLCHFLYTDELLDVWSLFPVGKVPFHLQTSKRCFEELVVSLRLVDVLGRVKPPKSLSSGFSVEPQLNDVVVHLANGATSSIYSPIACARSSYLSTVLSHRWGDQKEICLDHVEYSVFSVVLKYLSGIHFSGLFPETASSDELISFVLEVIELSDELLMEDLKDLCQLRIKDLVSLDNYFDLTLFSYHLGAFKLFENCMWFMYNNLELLLFDKEFDDLVNLKDQRFVNRLDNSLRWFTRLKNNGNIDSSLRTDLTKNSDNFIQQFINDMTSFNFNFIDARDDYTKYFEPIFEYQPITMKKRRSKSGLKPTMRKLSIEECAVFEDEPAAVSPSISNPPPSLSIQEPSPRTPRLKSFSVPRKSQKERKKSFTIETPPPAPRKLSSGNPWKSLVAPTPEPTNDATPSLSQIINQEKFRIESRKQKEIEHRKTSLAEIQQQDEFEKWWAEESARVQSELNKPPPKPRQKRKKNREKKVTQTC